MSGRSSALPPVPPFAGLAWYHDARALTGAIGSSVPTWSDLTSNGITVTQAVGATQPTIVAGPRTHGLNFNGSQSLASASGAFLGPGPWTMFAVLSSDATSSLRLAVEISDIGVTQGVGIGVRTGFWAYLLEGVGTVESTTVLTSTPSLLLIERVAAGAPTANVDLYADGALVATSPRVYATATASTLNYGQRANLSSFWKGTLYASGGVSRLLTTDEKAALLTLKNRFT